jgi:hypothetical protein
MSAAESTIRGDLEAALKQHAEPAEVEAEVVETVEAVEPAEQTAQERARDEKGRFAPKEADSAESSAEKPSVVVPSLEADSKTIRSSGDKPEQEGASASVAALAPPNGWTAEAKAVWHTLPQAVQEAAIKREQDVAKFTSTRDEHASFGKEMYQAVQPYLATIKAEGGTPATAVQSLLNTAYVLRTGTPEARRQMLLQTAQQFDIDLGIPAAKPNGQAANTPPELTALQREVAELKGLLSQRDQATQQQLQTEIQSELEAFAADPKHPHYSEVKAHMAALLREGVAKDLQDAYDQAVWARPDTRATLEAQRRAEEEQKRRTEAKAKAEAAKRRNVSLTGGPGNTAAAAAPGGRSIREELEAASAALSGAV